MIEKLSLNLFLRSCLEEKIDFSRIRIRRKAHMDPWNKYFPEGKEVEITYEGNTRFRINKYGWNSSTNMGDCEILSVNLPRKWVVVDIGEGWY